MDEKERQSAFLSAVTTEHFVLQTAANAALTEAGSRSSIYIISLSSALIAMGFASQSRTAFFPFVATVLPALFLLGALTLLRLVDLADEHMQCLTGIARIRAWYRLLSPEAAAFFAAETGRWPEARTNPALRLGPLFGFFTTGATMIAFIDAIVAGAGVTLIASKLLGGDRISIPLSLGVAVAAALLAAFYSYQRWRIMSMQPRR